MNTLNRENLDWAVDQTIKLLKNRDQSALDHHKQWVSAHGVYFRREHDRLVKERQPVRKFEPYR